jgi:serine/threonine-protein kinase RsbW
MRTLVFPASFEQLDAIRAYASQAALDAGMEEPEVCAVEMAVDEACSNIIEHAYCGQPGEIEITCDCAGDTLTLILKDHGEPFDPTAVPEPDLTCDLEDRHIGGLGIYLMRQLMDEVAFETDGQSGNILTMIKRRKEKG